MARFNGEIGYGESVEFPVGSGKWVDEITEYSYFGDVLRNTRRLEDSDQVNPNITVGNSISIVADEYANEHFHAIRYVKWAGVRWTVTSVEVRAPRLILDLGDVYNGPLSPSDQRRDDDE